ncbi:unnamed protein product, partial [Polarella glacialis]
MLLSGAARRILHPKQLQGPDWAAAADPNGHGEEGEERPWDRGEDAAEAGEEEAGGEGGPEGDDEAMPGGANAQAALQSGKEREEEEEQPDSAESGQDSGERQPEKESEHKGLEGSGPRVTSPSTVSGDDDLTAGGLDLPNDSLEANMGLLDVDSLSIENIEFLLSKLVGSIDRGRAELREHPGGSPRRWRSWNPREAGDFTEVDAVEMHRW